jgi:ParB family transcriptional regulator, chromosome partitioning protein
MELFSYIEPIQPRPHVTHNSENNEWYTPPEYLAAAREVLGTIDLDPASCAFANQIVQATTYFDVTQNGLHQTWQGKVWMNPPYATPLIRQFCQKFVAAVESGSVSEAIVLVNNATETGWFALLASVSQAFICPSKRIQFLSITGKRKSPLQGQVFLYSGIHPIKFLTIFKRFGWGGLLC